jgi:hypothetical protein
MNMNPVFESTAIEAGVFNVAFSGLELSVLPAVVFPTIT